MVDQIVIGFFLLFAISLFDLPWDNFALSVM
jgi:hypothetical protein